MASNNAAYLTATGAPLDINSAPFPEIKDGHLIVKAHALALNPVDGAQQRLGPEVFSWLKLPAILGCDVAGEVVAVGSGITKFKVGDRVAGCTMGTFQENILLEEQFCAKIPHNLAYEEASVLPLCMCVAVKTLFHPDYLALELPTSNTKPNGKVIFVWGGSTSVGCNIIQLANAAGFEVITTASPKNYDYLKNLGASQVFDYNSPKIQEELLAATKGKIVAGAIANGGNNQDDYPLIVNACAAIALSSPDNGKFIPLTMFPQFPLPDGVTTKFVVELWPDKDLASWVFNEYISGALERGKHACAPKPHVIGHGLESLQPALEILKAGVSAKKVVVTM